MNLLGFPCSSYGLPLVLRLLFGLSVIAPISSAPCEDVPEAVKTRESAKEEVDSEAAVNRGADPFASGSQISSMKPKGGDPIGVRVTTFLEVFSLSRQQVADLLLAPAAPIDTGKVVEELRRRCREQEANCRIQHQEAVTGVAGQEGEAESINEMIYPTEYEADGGMPSERPPQRVIAPTGKVLPTSFETRNVGSTLRVTPVLIRDGSLVAAALSWEFVTLLGTVKYDGGVEQPKFATQRIRTELVAKPGEIQFVGLVHPQPQDPAVPDPDLVSAAFVRFVVTQ